MLQECGDSLAFRSSHAGMSALAYRSLAVEPPTARDICRLQHCAQSRNQQEGLTGVLLYDRGSFFQWLEGPSAGLGRVWKSIKRDPRHRQIELLRDEAVGDRIFDGWNLRILHGSPGSVEQAVAALDNLQTSLQRISLKPPPILELSLQEVFTGFVLPRLRHSLQQRPRQLAASSLNWHARRDSAKCMANALLASSERESHSYVDSLLEQGAGLYAMYKEVFEPAQVRLGELWDLDLCDDFHLTMGLARLGMEIRRVNAALPFEHFVRPDRSVLLCAQPKEYHSAGLYMSYEMFQRQGWDVGCESKADSACLNELLHARWFDVLKVSLSGALSRDSCLDSLRGTIEAARVASQNPALIVMVDGRTFVDRPKNLQAVNADAAGGSAIDGPLIADRLVTSGCPSRSAH